MFVSIYGIDELNNSARVRALSYLNDNNFYLFDMFWHFLAPLLSLLITPVCVLCGGGGLEGGSQSFK